MAQADELAMHMREPTVMFASWRNVLLEVWGEEVSAAQVRRQAALKARVARAHPDGVGIISIITALRFRLPPDLRAAVEETTREMPTEVRAIAQVVEDNGFLAAALRSFTSTLSMLTKQRRAYRMFERLEPAVAWLLPQISAPGARALPAADVIAAVKRARG